MFDHLKWPLLEQQRNYLKLIMFYKILHEVLISLTLLSSSTHGHSQHFVTPFARTETYLHSFLPSTITLWNSLPSSLEDKKMTPTGSIEATTSPHYPSWAYVLLWE